MLPSPVPGSGWWAAESSLQVSDPARAAAGATAADGILHPLLPNGHIGQGEFHVRKTDIARAEVEIGPEAWFVSLSSVLVAPTLLNLGGLYSMASERLLHLTGHPQ